METTERNTTEKSPFLSSQHWLRLVYMLLFAAALQLASLVMWFVVIVQFLLTIFTGKNNEKLREFGGSLSLFIFQALQFLSYNTEEKPFPFADWPASNVSDNDR